MNKTTGLYATDKPDDIKDVMDIVKVNASKIYKSLGNNILASREELEGYGYLGLVDAYNTYSKEKWPKFTVYASFKVRGAIIDYLRTLNHSPSKYFKTMEKQVLDKIASGVDVVYDEVGNVKTIKNIIKDGSDVLVDIEYSDYLRLQQNNIRAFISLENSNGTMIADFRDSGFCYEPSPELMYSTKETTKKILKLAEDILDTKELYIIEQQFFNETTSQVIAETLKISPSRVSQIKTNALVKLKNLCLDHGVTYGL